MKSYKTTGQARKLILVEAEVPEPAGDQVLVGIRAISLNYRDLLYFDAQDTPSDLTLGSDASGVVVAVGPMVTGFSIGDRVTASFFTEWTTGRYKSEYRASALGGGRDGVFSSHLIVSDHSLVKIPDDISLRDAATLPCAAVTAWSALMKRKQLPAGGTILVQGTGGVSLYAMQLAKTIGAKVVLLTSSDEMMARARMMGADHCIDYKRVPNWEVEVLSYTNGEGVDLVLELVGNTNLSKSVRALRPEGTVAYIGCLGGFEGAFDPMELLYKNARLEATYVGSRHDLESTIGTVMRHKIQPVIDERVFAFDELIEALEYQRIGAHFGKVVLEVE